MIAALRSTRDEQNPAYRLIRETFLHAAILTIHPRRARALIVRVLQHSAAREMPEPRLKSVEVEIDDRRGE